MFRVVKPSSFLHGASNLTHDLKHSQFFLLKITPKVINFMQVPENLSKFVGNWKGNYKLYLSWLSESPFESQTNALVDFTAKGRFLKIEYDWNHEEKSQEGLILLGTDKTSEKIITFWIDSFHLSDKYMVSEGNFDENGNPSLKGFYAVPGHPDWGWRTDFDFKGKDTFKITMYNVSPEGVEELAVEAVYSKEN